MRAVEGLVRVSVHFLNPILRDFAGTGVNVGHTIDGLLADVLIFH